MHCQTKPFVAATLRYTSYTVCKFKKFPPGNLFFASTVEKLQILEYRKVAILPQGTVTTLIDLQLETVSKDMVQFFSGFRGGNFLNLRSV